MADLDSRKYRETDKENLVSLLQSAFGAWPRLGIRYSSLDYWTWKYKIRVLDDRIVWVIGTDEELYASIHSVLFHLKLFDETIVACIGGDVAVDSRFRQMGYWKKVLDSVNRDRVESGVKYLYNVTGNPIVINLFNKRGDYFRFSAPLANYVKIEDINLQLEKMPMDHSSIIKYGYSGLRLMNGYLNKKVELDSDIEVEEVSSFPMQINAFYDTISEKYDYILVRTKEYLDWRYCDKRGGDYTVFIAKKDETICGYIVVIANTFNEDYPIGYIVDLLVNENQESAGDLLIQRALDYFQENNVNIVNFLSVRGSYNESIIRRNGFIDSMKEVMLFFSHLGNLEVLDKINHLSPSRVHVCWGDTDTLPVSLESS